MQRKNLIELILGLHREMCQLTVDAGVSPETYEAVVDFDTEKATDSQLEALHTWLQILYDGPYTAVVKIWASHPRARWAYYFQMEEELTEIRILNQRRKTLNEEWKKPYYINGSKKRGKGSAVPSESAGANGSAVGSK